MNLNQFTIKAQEAIQQAFNIALGYNHQAVENGHLLKGILSQSESISSFLLKKLGINQSTFENVLDKIIESYPKVSGGEQYLSSQANKSLQKAGHYAKEFNDEFISVEHLLMGLFAAGDNVSQMMKDNGITEKDLKNAISLPGRK